VPPSASARSEADPDGRGWAEAFGGS
jgi:hypothetical protein